MTILAARYCQPRCFGLRRQHDKIERIIGFPAGMLRNPKGEAISPNKLILACLKIRSSHGRRLLRRPDGLLATPKGVLRNDMWICKESECYIMNSCPRSTGVSSAIMPLWTRRGARRSSRLSRTSARRRCPSATRSFSWRWSSWRRRASPSRWGR